MAKHVLFIQGGGDNGGYEEDAGLVQSLQTALGATYKVHYPRMPSDESLPDFGWLSQIITEIRSIDNELVLVGHSLGASLLLKCLSEHEVNQPIIGLFLIATPFWRGDEDWVKGLKLHDEFAQNLPSSIPIYFYQCRDDEEVPFEQFEWYKQKLPWATFQEREQGGHQFNNDLALVARDIKLL